MKVLTAMPQRGFNLKLTLKPETSLHSQTRKDCSFLSGSPSCHNRLCSNSSASDTSHAARVGFADGPRFEDWKL